MISVLIGASGHAKVVYDAMVKNKISIDGFIDPKIEKFYTLKKMGEDSKYDNYFIGVGGVTLNQIYKRHMLYLQCKNLSSPMQVISPSAQVSDLALVGLGTFIAAGAIVQASAAIGENVIINTGAIVEHDAIVECGVHIAPGAIVLGGAKVGKLSVVGSNSVILPGEIISPKTLIPALTRYKNDS